MKYIFLASKSPRRKEILQKAGFEYTVVQSDYEEYLDNREFSYEKIENIAKNKAFGAIKNVKKDGYILGADTVVVVDNVILTKPKDRDDAINILKKLSNRAHIVVTSHCILDAKTKEYRILSVTTTVEFNVLTDEMIFSYIDIFKPYDKAGAYGIQELPDAFIKSVTGDLENVIGLSSEAVKRLVE